MPGFNQSLDMSIECGINPSPFLLPNGSVALGVRYDPKVCVLEGRELMWC
jgi:hypothetical protein